MTDNNYPITPPPELVQKWINEEQGVFAEHIATQAARWGADQELEACCAWLHWQNLATHPDLIPSLRAARRPKPPSLKEQALGLIDSNSSYLDDDAMKIIRRALEQLND